MKSKLISFASDFSSYLILKLGKDNISNIILFGSVAREESGKDSDIDIFIDVTTDNQGIQIQIEKIKESFYSSTKFLDYWKPLSIKNEIRLIIGKFEDWKSLHESLLSNGICLFGKFKPYIKEGIHKAFFIWENIKPNSKRVLFNKQLFGFNTKTKNYIGMLQKYNGIKLGKGCISVPLEHSLTVHNLFKKYKIKVKIIKALEY